jgi:hypothetical protein
LAALKHRIDQGNGDAFELCQMELAKLSNPPVSPFHWSNGGLFKAEMAMAEEEAEEKVRRFSCLPD